MVIETYNNIARDWLSKFVTGLNCLNKHRSKNIWVTILSFCQNDSLMGESLWQKDRMVTHILFDLCLFKNFSPVRNFSNQTLGIISSIQKTIRWRYDHHQMILQSVPTTNQPSSVTRGQKKMTGDRQRRTAHENWFEFFWKSEPLGLRKTYITSQYFYIQVECCHAIDQID